PSYWSVRNHPKMDLAETQAISLQARFLPEGFARGTDKSQSNGQVASRPRWIEFPRIFSNIRIAQLVPKLWRPTMKPRKVIKLLAYPLLHPVVCVVILLRFCPFTFN